MKRKNFVSLVMAWTFLSISISGLLMYFDLKPNPVKGIHVLFGLILIGFGIFHLLNNWSSLKSYFKDKGTGSIRKELIYGSLIAGVVLLGAGFSIPPFPQIQRFGEEISREGGERKGFGGRVMFETVATLENKSNDRPLSLIIQKRQDIVMPTMLIWTEDSAHLLLEDLFVPEKVAAMPEGETDVREALEEGEVVFTAVDPSKFPVRAAAGPMGKSNHQGATPFDSFILETHFNGIPAFLVVEVVAQGKHTIYRTPLSHTAGASTLTGQGERLLERALAEWK
jgi:Domain of unknown function (DUF4405)